MANSIHVKICNVFLINNTKFPKQIVRTKALFYIFINLFKIWLKGRYLESVCCKITVHSFWKFSLYTHKDESEKDNILVLL